MSEGLRHVYAVERVDDRPGHVDVSLVRVTEQEVTRRLRRHRDVVERTVLFHRTFRPMVELGAMESYAARLATLARYANDGAFGCFVETKAAEGNVEVCLYERWFDGAELHTDELARRAFDASDEAALVASTEFVADLRAWADRRNDEREAAYERDRDTDQLTRSTIADRDSASRALADILAPHARSDRAPG
jgi:hypothetical protein